MSKNNENNRQKLTVYLGNRTNETASVPVAYFPKKAVIKSVTLLNGATIATATNMYKLQLKNGTSVLAEIDTIGTAEGAVTPLVGKVAPETDISVAAGSSLHLASISTGTGHLTDGQLVLDCFEL